MNILLQAHTLIEEIHSATTGAREVLKSIGVPLADLIETSPPEDQHKMLGKFFYSYYNPARELADVGDKRGATTLRAEYRLAAKSLSDALTARQMHAEFGKINDEFPANPTCWKLIDWKKNLLDEAEKEEKENKAHLAKALARAEERKTEAVEGLTLDALTAELWDTIDRSSFSRENVVAQLIQELTGRASSELQIWDADIQKAA